MFGSCGLLVVHILRSFKLIFDFLKKISKKFIK